MRPLPAQPAEPGWRPLLRATGTLVAVSAVLFVAGLGAGLALVGRHGGGAIQGVDNDVWRWFVQDRYLIGLAKAIATYGDAAALGVICAVLTVGLLVWRRSPLCLTPIVGYLGGEAQVYLIRQVIDRPRPLTAQFPAPGALHGVHETSWSYPSGHATAVTAVLIATLGAVALARRVLWPWIVAAAASIYVASSRLDLGVHWLSDVGVGLLLGAAWGVTVAVVATRLTWAELCYPVPPMRNDRPRHAVSTATSLSGPVDGP